MALKRRDSTAIGEVGKYLQEASQELIIAKQNIQKDVNNMLTNNYKGKDADVIGLKFEEAINRLDSLIERLDYYSKYMQGTASHDRENIQTANKQLNSILNNPIQDNLDTSLPESNELNQTLDVSDVNGGELHAL